MWRGERMERGTEGKGALGKEAVDKEYLRARSAAARTARLRTGYPSRQKSLEDNIAERFLENPHIARACKRGLVIASYEALPTEPPTRGLNRALANAGARVVVPQHADGRVNLRDLRWWTVGAHQLVASSPAELQAAGLSVVITPAMAVGRDGTRLGKGKGYYDRFFAALPRTPDGPLRLALVWLDEVFDSVPTDEHDEPVDDFIAVTLDAD